MTSLMSRMKFAGVVAYLLVLTGCATPMPLATPTGKPEVTIQGAKIEDVKNILTSVAMDWGYTVKNVTDYVAVYEKPNTNALSNALMASQYDPNTMWRLTYSLANLGSAVRVVTNIALVTNPGSAFERLTDFSSGGEGSQQFQTMLLEVKRRMEAEYTVRGRGKVGVRVDDKLLIIEVIPGSPAEAAGVKVGDRILSVDGELLLDHYTASMRITGEPGSVLELKVHRKGQPHSFKITRGQP
jgi:PDZ domain